MPDCCVNLLFLPLDFAPPVVGDFQGGDGKAYLQLGAVPVLCRGAPQSAHLVLSVLVPPVRVDSSSQCTFVVNPPPKAFSKVMGEAHRWAALVASFGLSLAERLLLLKTWVLPVLLLTARAYRATEQEERSLKVVFNTALGFDSWGTPLSQASLHPEEGGFSFPQPKPVQPGLAFTAFAQHQSVMPCFVRPQFRTWATKFVVAWNLRSLPFLQLGPVPYSTMGFLAQSVKSYSQARRYIIDGAPEGVNIGDFPLWHSAIFRNSDSLTYYCPALIRKGVLCISDLFDSDFRPPQALLPKIGITWREVYTTSIQRFRQLLPTVWSIPSVWVGCWGKSASLKKLSPMPYAPQRQPNTVWKAFGASRLPPFLKDFAYQALRAKLKVDDRLQNWTKFPWCPICANLETKEHALSQVPCHGSRHN